MSKPLSENIEGIYPLMLTPFNDDLTIDYKTYEEYCDFQVSKGTAHLFCVCGSSEMKELTLDERVKLATLTAKHKQDLTIVASANLESTQEKRIEEVKRMSQTGVDGLVFTVRDMGDKPDELVAHVKELESYTDLPIFMYEYPGFDNHLISGDTYGRLVRECKIKGIKDTTCTMEGITAKLARKGDSVVIQANMPFLYKAYEAGSGGVMATPTSCGAQYFQRFHDAFVSGDKEKAKQYFYDIINLDDAIDNGFNVSAKYLVYLQGVKGFKPINRSKRTLSPARLESLRAYHDYAKYMGLMD